MEVTLSSGLNDMDWNEVAEVFNSVGWKRSDTARVERSFRKSGVVRRAAPAPEEGEAYVDRGWMMTPPQYAALYEAISDRRGTLLSTPAQYEHCQHLPNWYGRLGGQTPRSV